MIDGFVYGVGVMSGTSLDGIDVCICKFGPGSVSVENLSILHFEEHPMDENLKQRVKESMEDGNTSLVCQLNVELGMEFARAVNKTLKNCDEVEKCSFVACHGQTLYHVPERDSKKGWMTKSSLQVGDSNIILEETGCDYVVNDFRMADISVGGQGAPLVPFFDSFCFGSHKNIALLNIGGISNMTILPECEGFDCGPGNMILDSLCKSLFGKNFDHNGSFSAKGKVDQELLKKMWRYGEDFYEKKGPKSTGRELFGHMFNRNVLEWSKELKKEDVLRTAVQHVVDAIWHHIPKHVMTVVVSGGGALNATLLSEMQNRGKDRDLTCVKLECWEHCVNGLTSSNKESVAFCLLGMMTLLGLPSNVPSVTGASKKVVQGKITTRKRVF